MQLEGTLKQKNDRLNLMILGKPVEKPLDRQVGGEHYKNFAIQPIEYCMRNHLDHCQSNVVKYVSRHKFKNGLEDLLKARHYIDILIEMEYGAEKESGSEGLGG